MAPSFRVLAVGKPPCLSVRPTQPSTRNAIGTVLKPPHAFRMIDHSSYRQQPPTRATERVMLRRGVLQAVRGAGQAAIPPVGSKRALHGSRPALAKILCSDSIDPVRPGFDRYVGSPGLLGWDGWDGRGAPPLLAARIHTRGGWSVASFGCSSLVRVHCLYRSSCPAKSTPLTTENPACPRILLVLVLVLDRCASRFSRRRATRWTTRWACPRKSS